METLYGLKRKTTNRWLKLLLLLFVAVGFGVPNLNAQTKAITVADNQQLIQALSDRSIGTVVLEPGYYDFLRYNSGSEARLTKSAGGGNRTQDCQYWIIDQDLCIPTTLATIDPPTDPNANPPIPIPPGSYYEGDAVAGVYNISSPFCPTCCPNLPNLGTWQWLVGESTLSPGATLYFGEQLNQQDMTFYVTGPGVYSLIYRWGSPWNSYVKTNYYFRGPTELELSAPDVCGLETPVTFNFTGLDTVFQFDVEWTLENTLTNEVYNLIGAPDTTGEFTFNLNLEDYDAECGYYKLSAIVYTSTDRPNEDVCPDTISIYIDFACQPIADAGPDANICDAVCYYSLHGSYGGVLLSPTHSWEWVQLTSPPGVDLVFDNPDDLVTGVCAVDQVDDCPYGEFNVQFEVTNGMCQDSDQTVVRFYEMPGAIAGPDQKLCNTFSFNLAAVPYVYCGEDGVNYWSHKWWTLESQPGNCAVGFDASDPVTPVNITNCDDACAYGQYVFVWHELNVKIVDGDTLWGETHCYASDEVVVTIFEDPVVDAGEDMIFCNTFAFSLYGIGDEPCYENTVVQYKWEKTSEPGHCTVEFFDANEPQPYVVLSNCDPAECNYGKYVFTFTQSNGYYDENGTFVPVCSTSDDVTVWNFEPPDANAGPDQHICDSFAFTLGAVPTVFCGVPIVDGVGNYNTWGEWSQFSGPAEASFDDASAYNTGITINPDDVDCPYGQYIFVWTEYNGFMIDGVFEGCVDSDTVSIFIDETPEPFAGNDLCFCETFEFYLDGALDYSCYQGTAYSYSWTLVSQPDNCTVSFTNPITAPGYFNPLVSITDCDGCPYGEYIFRLTQMNGYYDVTGQFVAVCTSYDDVSVWIWQEPEIGELTGPGNLCNTFDFSLTAEGSDYCGYHNNWYSWTLVSQPDNCEINITNGTTTDASVSIGPCTGECPYGEYVFKFSEFNGSTACYCEDSKLISVFIFEQPDADAGEDIHECVDLAYSPFCFDMNANLEYCYTMYGVWSKSCGPGNVEFTDIYDPKSEVCIPAPGRYIFTWTLSNDACQDADDILIDLLEQPTASAENTHLVGECDSLCINLGLAGVIKYHYFGTDQGTCPNFWDRSHWTYVSGPTGDPTEVSFANDTDPATELCVSTFGCYTVRWNEVNKPDDKDYFCSDYVDINVQFVQTPVANAGDDASICGHCYTMTAIPFIPANNNCPPSVNQSYWSFLGYIPPAPFCDIYIDYYPCFELSNWNDPNTQLCICEDDYDCYGSHYGTYGFTWTEINGPCTDVDTVWITFNKIPDPVPLYGCISNDNCMNFFGPADRDVSNCGCVSCWYPEDGVFTVCSNTCGYMHIDWNCIGCPPIPGYTYEWSFIGPSGSSFQAQPMYYDCECGWRGNDYVYLCFGECCDTARLYLTITSPQGCVTTEEWKFYVQHPPVATIIGPAIAEVGDVIEYTIPDPQNPCYLYTWNVAHCGEIVYGQGTGTIGVQWTDYNVNGGWGLINVCVYDTCTCCCNCDSLVVKVYPQGTLGDATLAGHVYYHNNYNTPLDGVEIQLWNGGIPVQTTTSFDDIEGGNGVGYFEFPGINGTTNFGVTASYDAPWYGANATDALAVQLKVINSLPYGFIYDNVVFEAMDVNNSNTVSATDALWIKQRAINMVNYFPAGNWVFDPTMSASAASTPYDIYTLNAGDANRSNIPNSMKTTPAINLVTDGTINVVTGQVFELPVRIADANQFGAITLDIGYNSSLIKVVDVVTVEGMLDNISDGNVSIAWSSVNPMILAANDVVVTLKVKALSPFTSAESIFSIGINSEFADPTAKVVEPVTLKTYGVTTAPAATEYFLSSNRPNPFSNSTFIEYTMPESGKVKLSVLDMLGQEIAVLVDATQSAGSYTVEFSAAGLSTGVYLYKITVNGETRDFISTQRMVISH